MVTPADYYTIIILFTFVCIGGGVRKRVWTTRCGSNPASDTSLTLASHTSTVCPSLPIQQTGDYNVGLMGGLL